MRKANMQIFWNRMRKLTRYWSIMALFSNLAFKIGINRNHSNNKEDIKNLFYKATWLIDCILIILSFFGYS